MNEQTHWTALVVHDSDERFGDLGDILRQAPATLYNATIRDGKIAEWPGYFLATPGEAPAWDTPKRPVDWSGFELSLASAREDDSETEPVDGDVLFA